MDEYNYDALACTVNIEDITSREINRNILRLLKDDDPSLTKLWICDLGDDEEGTTYIVSDDDDDGMGWLGYFIGKSSNLKEVNFYVNIYDTRLFKGLSNNKSIRKICIVYSHIFERLDPFLKNNHNLADIDIQLCGFDDEGAHQLSQVLGGCNSKSLKRICLSDNEIEEGQLLDIIQALNTHPQLEVLDLSRMGIERNSCLALSTLLANTTKKLQTLNLEMNNIDDEGIEALVHAISGSQLQELNLDRNNLGDDGALMFASALRGNCKLKVLTLHDNRITAEGWAHFSRLLCDPSSINNTYLSNHTLRDMGTFHQPLPTDLLSSLDLNASRGDRRQIATIKILQHHSHFNMQPFFEWELKVLPLVIDWLGKARTRTSDFREKINRMKLSVIYDFVREFPMLYIEPVTRKEIEECSAMEEQLLGDDPIRNASQLEEVQQRKTRAMRRLL